MGLRESRKPQSANKSSENEWVLSYASLPPSSLQPAFILRFPTRRMKNVLRNNSNRPTNEGMITAGKAARNISV